MHLLSFGDALTQIQQQLNALRKEMDGNNTLLAVTGCVASGKSRFCSSLRSNTEVLLRKPIIYLPFDLWINTEKREASEYAQRFFMEDLTEAVRCIKSGKCFLVPRYDIIKTAGHLKDFSRSSTQKLLWNERSFLRREMFLDAPQISGATDFYVDPDNRYLYSLFPASTGECFIIDGTLVAPRDVSNLYDLRVFMQAPWPLRVARMIRRFNRKEVFGTTKKTMRDYVGFLVAEARQCADAEIQLQIDDGIMLVDSVPDTLSNYLDLAYLRQLTEQPEAPNWVDRQEVEATMQEYLEYLQEIHDATTISRYQQELKALTESKHLLALSGVDQLLAELAFFVH